ncbi:hypothetical protein VTJ04DRAFT_9884 [Mycothermus thermophilus]|uniref:uncharacterized protein n=1 Tax=Humicola insolens TaxID=85995 RepID=UPI003742FCF4
MQPATAIDGREAARRIWQQLASDTSGGRSPIIILASVEFMGFFYWRPGFFRVTYGANSGRADEEGRGGKRCMSWNKRRPLWQSMMGGFSQSYDMSSFFKHSWDMMGWDGIQACTLLIEWGKGNGGCWYWASRVLCGVLLRSEMGIEFVGFISPCYNKRNPSMLPSSVHLI